MGRRGSNPDDSKTRNVDVVVILGDDRYAEREGGGGDPRVVDRHSLLAVAQQQAEPGPRLGDRAVNRYWVECESLGQSCESAITCDNVGSGEDPRAQLSDRDDRNTDLVGKRVNLERSA